MLLCFVTRLQTRFGNLDSFAGQFSLTAGANMFQALTGMATGLLTARLLGPTGLGELTAIRVWVYLIGSLATLGMAEAVVYFVGKNPDKGGRYVATAQLLNAIPGAFFILVGWMAMPLLLSAQSASIIAAAQVFLLAIVPLFLSFVWYESLRPANQWLAWNILRLAPNTVWLVILVVMFFFPEWATPINLSRIFPFCFLFQVIPSIIIARRALTKPFRFERALARPLAKYGIPTTLTVLPMTLNLNLDQLLMASLLQPQELGLYVAAVAWAGAPMPIILAIGQVLFPRLSAIPDLEGQARVLKRVLGLTLRAVLGFYSVLFVLTPFVLPLLFGARFADAVPAALVLVVANSFNAFNNLLTNALYGLGHPKWVLAAQLIGLGITAVFLTILLPRIGMMGAAITSVFAYATICGLLLFAARRAIRSQGLEKGQALAEV